MFVNKKLRHVWHTSTILLDTPKTCPFATLKVWRNYVQKLLDYSQTV